MRNILCHGLWLSLLLCCVSTLRAEELPALNHADEKLLESLFKDFLFDPQGAERVAVKVPNRTRHGEKEIMAEGWCIRGIAGKPDFVHFSDGPSSEVKPEHALVQVDFVANCRGRYVTQPPSPLDEKQLREFRQRGWEASRGLIDEHDLALAAWLYRLGEPQLAAAALQQARQQQGGDLRKNLRQHLASKLYTRVFQCYVRREDEQALQYGELLVERYPEYDQEVLVKLGPSLIDELRRRKKQNLFGKPFPEIQPQGYTQWPLEKQVAYQIDALDEVKMTPYTDGSRVPFEIEPRVKELARLGDAAVPALIETLENDERLTRSADRGQFSLFSKVVGVRDAAFVALKMILRLNFPSYQQKEGTHYLTEQGPEQAKKLAAFAREHWAIYGQFPLEQRMLKILQDALPEAQLTAAENLADLGTEWNLSRVVPRDAASASNRGAPPVDKLLKLENPTVAEAIFATMEQAETTSISTSKRAYTPEERSRVRQSFETQYLPCLVKLGDRRIAAKLRTRLDEKHTPLGRLELAASLHYLGDSGPLNDFANEFRQGKIEFTASEVPRFKYPPSTQPSLSFQQRRPPGRILVRALSSAKLPAADQALHALTDNRHPLHALAAEYYSTIDSHYANVEFVHPFALQFLVEGLEDRTPTDTSAEVRGNSIQYITNPKSNLGEELPSYLADPAQRQESVVQRRCDIYGRRLSSLMFGGPRFHPLLKDPDARLAELKQYYNRHAGRFRRLEWYELKALWISSSNQFIPNYAVLTKPATAADVAEGRAMFTLGENAAVSGLKLPAVAVLAKNQALMNPPHVLIVQAEVDATGKTSYGVIGIEGLQVLHDGEVVNIESIEKPAG